MPNRFGRGQSMSGKTSKKPAKVTAPTKDVPVRIYERAGAAAPRREWKKAVVPIVAQVAYRPLNLNPDRLPR